MRKRTFFALLTLAATAASSASCTCSRGAKEQKAEVMVEHASRDPNGLTEDLVSGPCGANAALVVLLNAGIDHDPPGRSGMGQVIARLLAGTGADRQVEIGDDYTLYSVVVPADRIEGAIDDVAAWMARYTPSEADLARAKAAVMEEAAKRAGPDAAATAESLAEESMRPTRGNGKRRGIADEVSAITLPEVLAVWQARFKAGNARLTVAGRFDAEKVKAKIAAAIGPVPAGAPEKARELAEASVRGTLVMGDAPKAVAIAVPAPAVSDAAYAPFLILAARLQEKPAQPRTWEVAYDPVRRPELLFITGPVGSAEQPEPAAARMRTEVAAALGRPAAKGDAVAAREAFRFFLDAQSLDPKVCTADPRAFAIARAIEAQHKVDGARIGEGLAAVTPDQLTEAAQLFGTKRSAAVIAGGTLR